MKQFPKPIRQCLVTAVATSTLLEAHALPLLSATAAEAPPAPTTETAEAGGSTPQAVVKRSASSQSAPTLLVTPQLIEAAQTYTQATPLSIPAESAADLNVQAIPEGPAPADASVNAEAAPPAPTTTPAPVEATTAPAAGAASPESAASDRGNGADAVGTARQNLEKRLAAIVERDKSSREAQLRQNLVNAALQQAQVGEFERARQIAQHPALPVELQADVLTQIATIEAQLTGQPQPVTAEAKPAGQPPTAAVAAAVAAPVPADAAPDYWVAPAAPERINTYLSDRCLNQTAAAPAPAARPAAPKPAKAVIAQLARQSAASLARFDGLANPAQPVAVAPASLVPPPAGAAAPAQLAPASAPNPAADRRTTNLPQLVQAALEAERPALEQVERSPLLAPDASLSEPGLDRMVESTLSKPLKRVGFALPLAIPAAVRSVFGEWIDLTAGGAKLEVMSGSDASAPGTRLAAVLPAKAKLLARDPYVLRMKQQIAQPAPVQAPVNLTTQKTIAPKATSPVAKATPAQEPAQLADYRRVLSVNCSEFQNGSEPVTYEIDPALSKQQGWRSMMFPLPIPAVVTSLFGWRTHPIFGDRRFHTGLDIGAASGTPVLAALAGRVVAADYMGGYGLAVVIETATGSFRNLYGHLSAIAVRPGTWVEQGNVLGLVGSTGNSTGPHLHFETQVLTEGSWTAIDPLAAAAVSIAQAQASN